MNALPRLPVAVKGHVVRCLATHARTHPHVAQRKACALSAPASKRIYWNLLRQGCSGRSLQVIGWSGRHPRGRETRRTRWQARSADRPPWKAFVFRADTFSPRASHRVPSASHLIAGFSPHEQLAARGPPSRPLGCAPGRRDAVQGCARSTGPSGCSVWSACTAWAISSMYSCSSD